MSAWDALDDFAGPGGWDVGAQMIGLDLYGVDYDKSACETARAAGFAREQADITDHVTPEWAYGKGHVSSPSCTLFSMAGSGVGRMVLDVLADGIRRILRGESPEAVRKESQDLVYPVALGQVAKGNKRRQKPWSDKKVADKARLDAKVACLVLEPARRIVEMDPEWVALEQVPEVLPLWEVYRDELRNRGWSVWALVLNAADYGVPQTRRRAILGGSRVRKVSPPVPTHAESPQDEDLFGSSMRRWVSMAEALGFSDDVVVRSNYNSGTKVNGERVRAMRLGSEPASTVTSKTGSVKVGRPAAMGDVVQKNGSVRATDQPAATVLASMDNGNTRWVFDRPATTVVGSFSPDVIAAPGYRTEISRQNAPGSVSVSEAGVLQSFPADYDWRGTKSKKFEQVGNAIPPRLAAHVLGSTVGVEGYADMISAFYDY